MEKASEGCSSVETLPILEAEHVYILMSQEYRISRNRRAEWFFTHINSVIALEKKYKVDECSQELDVISVIPVNPPASWNRSTSHLFRYRICSKTVISFFSKKYRLVYCLDISPSAASVDVQSGMVLFDGIFEALKLTMEGITKPFLIPGSEILFKPKIYITVIAHAPVLSSIGEQVIVQGILLAPESLREVVSLIFEKLSIIENKIAALTSSINESVENAKIASDRILGGMFDEEEKQIPSSSLAMTSDFGLVDLLQHALIALNLLPENSTAGLIIVTDGVLSVPDGGFLESILSQLRYNTVSCSFINLSSPFHPHLCYGMLSYADLMRFISSSTFGTFMTLSSVPELKENSLEMNVLHRSFLSWNFQRAIEDSTFVPPPAKPGEWSVRNKCFFSVRDMPIVKKQQFSSTLSVDYMKVLSCRLREGYTIKEVTMIGDEKIEIKLNLPWKFCIYIEYILTTCWPPVPKVGCVVSLEGPYDFLHDVTCLAKKPFRSYYRQLMVARYWASRKNLSESDKLLVHFNLFSSNPAYYNVPESLRNGVPLFYISSNSSHPGLQSSECGYTQFTQFWKPVCLLDTTIWQKWMHTHRIGIILEHDHPLPKHLHLPNSSGRFHVVQCRQAAMSLNTLLKDCSSFVLVENQNYIKLMYRNNEKIPFSFYIIRVTSKAPFVVLRIAFLVGTPGHLRHEEVSGLREKISSLTYPQRPKEPPKWRAPPSSLHRSFKRTWSDMPCCILLHKPIEKILIRYERVPKNFFRRLLPQTLYQNVNSPKITAAKPSTFGFRTTQQGPWGSSIKIGPEVFNTVARYLVHRRWIWALQNPPHQSISINCAAKILSTLTKLRLQEGFRFGCSTNGTVNMILELQMVNEWVKKPEESIEVGEKEETPEPEIIPCILQYIIFPPTTSLLGIEEEEVLDGDTAEEPNELYLVVEAWVEPQCGRILPSGPERSFLDNLEYQEVSDKIFAVDRGCITALVTFEHLCLMCQDVGLSNSTINEIGGGETKSKWEGSEGEEGIQYLPFSFELNQILPKSQQAEVLFSMFNQDLATSYPVDGDTNKFCDGANMTLYDLWMKNVTKLYDREVFLLREENETILRLIIDRKREPEEPRAPIYDRKKTPGSQGWAIEVSKWRCFVKKLSPTHLILTLFPTSFRDLKLLMLSEKGMEERAVEFLPESENYFPDHFQFESVPSPTDSPQTTPKDGKRSKKGKSNEQSRELPKNPSSSNSMSRKRSRVKSGGESGPASKRPLKRKNSVDNSFRFRTGSIDGFWSGGIRSQRTRYRSAEQTLGPSFVLDKRCSLTDAERSSRCPSASTPKFSDASSSPKTEVGKEGKPKYGALTLPLYVYDSSLSALTEHAIFRSVPTLEDFYVDCRVISESCLNTGREEEEALDFQLHSPHHPEEKHVSPEPKSEDSEPISPEAKAVLQNHCLVLETLFAKAYVRGLFESLQKGYFIHRNDVQVAVSMCAESLVEINLTEFIQTICGHMKEMGGKDAGCSPGTRTAEIEGCDELGSIHEFIKKKFTALLLSSFSWMADYSDFFYFSQHPLDLGWVNESRRDESHSSPKTHHSEQEKEKSKLSSLSVSNNVSEDESIIANETPERPNTLFTTTEALKSEVKVSAPQQPLTEESHEWNESERESIPLFLYITCTFKYGSYVGSFVIRNIPTCVEEIFSELQDSINFDDMMDLEKLELIMDFVFLTIPPEIEEFEGTSELKTRSLSSYSISPQQIPQENITTFSSSSKDTETEDKKAEPEPIVKRFPPLPRLQLQIVKKTVEDIKWLLKDEITSFKWQTGELTEETLSSVALHVEKSKGKPGCLVNKLPLTFPKNLSINGFEKFKQRFRDLTIEGFRLTQVGSWFYLVDTLREQTKELSDSQIFSDKNESVFHQDEEFSQKSEKVTEEMLRDSLERQSSFLSDGEDAEVAELAEKASRAKGLRRGFESEETVEAKEIVTGTPSLLPHHHYLTTPSQLSEISSLVGSLITNEDGYEGDGSESGGEDEQQTDMDIRKTKLPPFWMIFYIGSEEITTYFHCRYNEEDLAVFHFSSRLREQISKLIFNLRRIVNQDLLLQELHDSRNCSSLLEPENEDCEMWEMSPVVKKHILPFEDEDRDPYLDLYEGRSPFSPGHFSCDVVWDTKFILHSRLRTVKSSMSRGIQTLQTTLIAFEVLNRRNMFVYRDSSGNVFYMRLYRIQEVQNSTENEKIDGEKREEKEDQPDKSGVTFDSNDGGKELLAHMSKPNNELKAEDVVLLQVHGTTEAGFEIKEQLVQSLRNKLDDAVLDILSVTLDRNPHCKLTPEDVHFIQKPFSNYDNILKYGLSNYAAQYIPAFAFYLHQNLLQFLHIPKYTDLKAVNHFQDFSMVNSEEFESMEKNVYLYNQSPEGTGSRGIACLAVAILNSTGGLYANANWNRPPSDIHTKEIDIQQLAELIKSEEISIGESSVVKEAYVEIRIWKQGRINVDLLKNYVGTAMKHAIWDLLMEFNFLTAPISSPLDSQDTTVESQSPISGIGGSRRCESISGSLRTRVNVEERTMERRNSANLHLNESPNNDNEPPRTRSMSFSARKPSNAYADSRHLHGRAPSPLTLVQSSAFERCNSSKLKYQLESAVTGLNSYEGGELGRLHPFYGPWFKEWCKIGQKIAVPSLRVVSIPLGTRTTVDITAHEVERIINSVAPDNTPRQFWRFGSSSSNFVAGGIRAASKDFSDRRAALEEELKELRTLELSAQSARPQILRLFEKEEDMDPSFSGHRCLILSRNFVHWKSCISSEPIFDSLMRIPEAHKNIYKFPPFLAGEVGSIGGSMSSQLGSMERMSRVNSSIGLASLLNEPESIPQPLLIPRQRLLLAKISPSHVIFVFYNWSKESSERLVEQTKCLALWIDARTALLSSLLVQKAGLFHNQGITRNTPLPGLFQNGNPFCCGAVDVDSLIRHNAPPKEFSTGRIASIKKAKNPKALASFIHIFKNIKHASTLKIPDNGNLKTLGEQMSQVRSSSKKDSENALFQHWLLRGPNASNVIGTDGIDKFKQAARIIHYCMTPIIFLQSWRTEVAATRDSSLGISKRYKDPSDSKRFQLNLRDVEENVRSRHGSGASTKSSEPVKSKGKLWGFWGGSSRSGEKESPSSTASIALGSKRASDKWHNTLCDSFIQEYIQYLQTHGFIHLKAPVNLKSGNGNVEGGERTRVGSGSGKALQIAYYGPKKEEENPDRPIHYLQKSLQGGILVFEIGFSEPFFYAKIYALEATRIKQKKSKKSLTINTLAFVTECERMKDLMHLHSFTYDFHLRSIHSYISGRQLIFKQGYHLTSFLDDFIKYYPKGPSFARNTVHIGLVTMQNVTTPSHILYNYILGHEKLYKMKVIRMNPESEDLGQEVVNEYILVHISSKKVTYKDMEDESQYDDFDLTLLIAHDAPPVYRPYSIDPSVLRLKYYIVLTSRREPYPKVSEERREGKLCIVNMPEVLSNSKSSSSWSPTSSVKSTGSGPSTEEPTTLTPNLTIYHETEEAVEVALSSSFKTFEGIREEQVQYMGYFSSHEQLMGQMVSEQVAWVESYIRDSVSLASVDCRRELLWQRLLTGDDKKSKKDDLFTRETSGALTYWEFSELLELVTVKSLSESDSRLSSLLKQPLSFYQNLLKQLTVGNQQTHRYFVAPDNSTHQVAIFSPNVHFSVVMLEINFNKHAADLSVLKKVDKEERNDVGLEGEILNLIESVVNSFCYSSWANLL